MIANKEVVWERGNLFEEVLSKLNSGGLTIAEFEEKRHLRIAPGVTLEEFIADEVNLLGVRLEGDKLVWNREFKQAGRAYFEARSKAETEAVSTMKTLNLHLQPQSHQ